jgi:hypothetical protein
MAHEAMTHPRRRSSHTSSFESTSGRVCQNGRTKAAAFPARSAEATRYRRVPGENDAVLAHARTANRWCARVHRPVCSINLIDGTTPATARARLWLVGPVVKMFF